jgi:hypothetical protein
MRPNKQSAFFNIIVTRILHVDGSGDASVVLAKPTATQVYRHSLSIEVALHTDVQYYMKPGELQKWLTDLYKSSELEANHKSLDEIAAELSTRVADEFDSIEDAVVHSIKILNGNYGVTYHYG